MAENATEDDVGPENVTQDDVGFRESLSEGAGEIREDFSKDNIETKLRESVQERPVLKYLLDMGIVLRALLIAAIICLIVVWVSPKAAGFFLVVGFLGAWAGLAVREYNRRRPTEPANPAEDDDDE